jgi:hypothetical protein
MARQEQTSGVLGLQANLDKKNNPYLATDDMWEVQGFYPKEGNSLTKRGGFARFNQTQLSISGTPATFTGIFEYTPSSGATREQIATTATAFYKFGDPAAYVWNAMDMSNIPAMAADPTYTKAAMDGAILEDILYMGNGTDGNVQYDGLHSGGGKLYKMGIDAPTGAATYASDTSGGSLTTAKAYQYVYTYVDRFGRESNPSPASASHTVTSPNLTVHLTGLTASSDAQVTDKNIYRTTGDGAVFLYLDTITNVTTTYTDTTADVDLAEEVEMFANGVPPKFSMIEIYRGVAFMAGGTNKSRVYFSWPGNPAAVDSNDFRDLDPNDGDVITGIHKFQNTLIVTKNNSVWILTGEDRNTFGFEKRVTSAGAVSNTCILEVPTKNYVVMLSNHPRFFLFDGTIAAPHAAEIEPLLRNLNLSQLHRIVGAVIPSQNQCRWIVPSTTGKAYCDKMIWYDYVLDKWGTTDLPNTIASHCATMRDVDGIVKFYLCGMYDATIGSTSGGWVWEGDFGGSDNGENIACQVTDRGHPRNDPNPENQKTFDTLIVWYQHAPGTQNTTMDVYVLKDDPDDGTPHLIGTILCNQPSGQHHLHMNETCRRLYVQIRENSKTEGLVLRGWKLVYKDVGRWHAP